MFGQPRYLCKYVGTTGQGVVIPEGVEDTIRIAANTALASYFPLTQPTYEN